MWKIFSCLIFIILVFSLTSDAYAKSGLLEFEKRLQNVDTVVILLPRVENFEIGVSQNVSPGRKARELSSKIQKKLPGKRLRILYLPCTLHRTTYPLSSYFVPPYGYRNERAWNNIEKIDFKKLHYEGQGVHFYSHRQGALTGKLGFARYTSFFIAGSCRFELYLYAGTTVYYLEGEVHQNVPFQFAFSEPVMFNEYWMFLYTGPVGDNNLNYFNFTTEDTYNFVAPETTQSTITVSGAFTLPDSVKHFFYFQVITVFLILILLFFSYISVRKGG